MFRFPNYKILGSAPRIFLSFLLVWGGGGVSVLYQAFSNIIKAAQEAIL
jgi:hypothetical protein